jgi:hypothetical protein
MGNAGGYHLRMADIDLTPTEEMASNAARGLELREKHGRGGTAVGVARARDIKNRKNLSPDTVRRMHSFFSRHAGNEAGGEDDAGYISFLLWGGAAGRSWAKRKSAQLDKDENAMSDTRKEIMERLGMAAHPGAKAKMGGMRGIGDWAVSFTNIIVERLPELRKLARDLKASIKVSSPSPNGYVSGTITRKYGSSEAPDLMASGKVKSMIQSLGGQLDSRLAGFSRPGAKAKFSMQFEVGKTYEHSFANDSDSRVIWKVMARSGAMLTIKQVASGYRVKTNDPSDYRHGVSAVNGETKRVKIHSDERGEYAYPFGRYSMAPSIRATDVARGFSRPGAKAKMAYAPSESDMKKWMKGWTLRLPMVPDAGIRHFNSFEEAKRYGDAKCGGFSCEISYDGRRVASKGALSPEGSWTKHSRKGTKTGMRRMTQQETSHLKAWIGKNFRTTEEMMDAMTKMEKVFEEDSEHWESRSWPEVAKAAGVWSRPGAKAKMAKPQFRVRKLHGGYLAVDMNQGSGWERYDTTHEEVFDGLEDYERGYQKAYDRGLRWSGGSWRIPSTKASRPGAKARHALTDACWKGYEAVGTKQKDGKTVPNCVPKNKNAIREGEKVSASDDAVSRKIRKLMDEGKPQKQAVAIALDLERRGEL